MTDPTGPEPGASIDAVEGALTRLEGIEARPVEEHPAVFESVHDSLSAVLSGDPRA